MNTDLQIKITPSLYSLSVNLYIFKNNKDGGMEFLQKDGYWQNVKEGSCEAVIPTLVLSPDLLPKLADELARNGYRAEQGFDKGKLEATEKHLEDMRRLTFYNIDKHYGEEA